MSCNVCEGMKPKLRGERQPVRCNLCEREFNGYVKDDWGLGGAIARRESFIGTGICADCGEPSDMDKGLCNDCHIPRKGRAGEVANPYKKVWNAVEDEEVTLLNSVRNGTLFVPTYAILAERSRSTARYLTDRAKKMGVVGGHAALKEADGHIRQAEAMEKMDNKIKEMRQPRVFGFTVKED